MKEGLYREKNVKKMSSPDDLNGYLHVTSTPVWVALISVIIILVALLIWSRFAVINSYAYGSAIVEKGIVTVTFEDRVASRNITEGMTIELMGETSEILTLGRDKDGYVVATGAMDDLPDGKYDSRVSYDQIQIIEMLFN